MIVLADLDDRMLETWKTLLELSRRHPEGWTLVGAQMVALYAAEHGQIWPRVSIDADVLANVRVVQGTTAQVSRELIELGFSLEGMSAEQVGHRFRRGKVLIDVLAPEGLGKNTSITTVPPARTVSVPGGTQALNRTERVEVSIQGDTGFLPRPNLLGAILLKCQAVDVDDAPDSQRIDLAFLLSLVQDPRMMARDLEGRQRSWLRRRRELLDNPDHPAWRALGSTEAAQTARLALRVLAGA